MHPSSLFEEEAEPEWTRAQSCEQVEAIHMTHAITVKLALSVQLPYLPTFATTSINCQAFTHHRPNNRSRSLPYFSTSLATLCSVLHKKANNKMDDVHASRKQAQSARTFTVMTTVLFTSSKQQKTEQHRRRHHNVPVTITIET